MMMRTNDMAGKGIFISVEGGDGSGKSTQFWNIKRYFDERGIKALFLREPGSTPIGEKIREILLDRGNSEMTPETEALLYAASRAQLVREKIIPAIKAGGVVVCDRFVDSSIAYQGYGRMLGEPVRKINAFATGGILPDLTFFLDIAPEAAEKRMDNPDRAARDRLEVETRDFRRRVYNGYLALLREDSEKGVGKRFVIIDASKSPEEVWKAISDSLDAFLDGAERQ
ncbi:MAG: dTMP kinase [Eubacterium sp.]|jgi:dTMP kinase